MDLKLNKELDKKLKNSSGNDKKALFPEHEFIGTCLKVGLTIEDLKTLTYVDVMKILVSMLPNEEEQSDGKKATQQDISNFLG